MGYQVGGEGGGGCAQEHYACVLCCNTFASYAAAKTAGIKVGYGTNCCSKQLFGVMGLLGQCYCK